MFETVVSAVVQVPTSPILGEGGRPIGSHTFSAIGAGSRHEGFATDRYNSTDAGAAAPGQQGRTLTLHVSATMGCCRCRTTLNSLFHCQCFRGGMPGGLLCMVGCR